MQQFPKLPGQLPLMYQRKFMWTLPKRLPTLQSCRISGNMYSLQHSKLPNLRIEWIDGRLPNMWSRIQSKWRKLCPMPVPMRNMQLQRSPEQLRVLSTSILLFSGPFQRYLSRQLNSQLCQLQPNQHKSVYIMCYVLHTEYNFKLVSVQLPWKLLELFKRHCLYSMCSRILLTIEWNMYPMSDYSLFIVFF